MSRTCGLITPKDNTPGWVDEYDVSMRGLEGARAGTGSGTEAGACWWCAVQDNSAQPTDASTLHSHP